MNNRILQDSDSAKEKFRAFEFAYRLLKPDDLKYLREQSAAYKQAVMALQELILPAVRTHCPSCPYGMCCRISAPEINIYIAGAIGCFGFKDFLLVRCDSELPVPDYANAQKNLCPFWDNGCRLRPDSRSLTCLSFFCEQLHHDLDMDSVNRRFAEVQSVVNNFSIGQLLKKQHQ